MVKLVLKAAVFVLVALSLAIPSISSARFTGPDVSTQVAATLTPGGATPSGPAWAGSEPIEPGSFPKEGSDRHFDPVLDGESDDFEPIDDLEWTSGSSLVLADRSRSVVSGPAQHGFAEGLFSARASRGPPQD
jgi:hypothetical protein